MTIKRLCNPFTAISSLTLALLLSTMAPVMAAETDSSSDWEYLAEIYFWGANMETKTTGGQEVDLPFYQILDSLDFAFMTEVGARNDKWSVMTDVIYMNLSQKNKLRDATLPGVGNVTVNDKVDMKSWIVTPTVGYVLLSNEDARVEVLGGLRYLSLDLAIQIDVNDTEVFNKSASEGFLDGIIGMRADINVSQNWYMPLYIDIGWGESDSTWQAYGGLGYHFSRFDATLTYRRLDYEFDHPVAADLVVKGPLLGAVFKF